MLGGLVGDVGIDLKLIDVELVGLELTDIEVKLFGLEPKLVSADPKLVALEGNAEDVRNIVAELGVASLLEVVLLMVLRDLFSLGAVNVLFWNLQSGVRLSSLLP